MTHLRLLLPVLLLLCATSAFAQAVFDPPYSNLYEAVQHDTVFEDSKTFADCEPLKPIDKIFKKFKKAKKKKSFDIKSFVKKYFKEPAVVDSSFKSDRSLPIEEHIEKLWGVLTKEQNQSNNSFIGLPNPYVVPGGRFQEMYYWDSYFTMLGLVESGRLDLAKNMLDNCSYLIDQYGFVPNGNRTYYLSRSQPPVYSMMVRLVVENDTSLKVEDYLPFLEREYAFWMNGAEELTNMNSATKRVVLMPHGEIMNRYWDEQATPRPEAYREDVYIESQTSGDSTMLYRNIRAACESGWDFSSRWLGYTNSFATLQTTDIIPIDLNCLLYHLEVTLAEAYLHLGNGDKGEELAIAADYRKNGILKYCWQEDEGFFMDYAFWDQYHTGVYSLAAVFPLFFEIATDNQVLLTVEKLENEFLKEGGLVTSLKESGEQWDSPNGWAPLQFIAVEGLRKYQYDGLADDVVYRWTNNVNRIYEETGKILEKYNVIDVKKKPVGREYPNQDGFGWTNAIYLKLMAVEEIEDEE